MRFRLLIGIALLMLLPCAFASADMVSYENTTYIYPGETPEGATLTLRVQGESFDPDTYEAVTDASLAGAAFSVYVKTADGEYALFTDPQNPLQPLTITTGEEPITVLLPTSVDLYLKQESAPDGYSVDADTPEYQRLSLSQTLTYVNRHTDMQGMWLTLTGDGETGDALLSGVSFTLEGMGETYALTTNEDGKAAAFGIAPGTYTLTQTDTVDGYLMDTATQTIEVPAQAAINVTVRNSREATLTLRTLGLVMDGERNARLIPIARSYELFDEAGMSYGTLVSGESTPLPASQDGTTYTLRATDDATDGYAADTQTHTITLTSGQALTYETIVRSERGFFSFSHISTADGQSVAGGTFTLYNDADEPVLTFDADESGQYEAETPLPPGDYTLLMHIAADGYLYASEPLPLSITSYFDDPQAIAQAVFASTPVPEALLTPSVTTVLQTLPSLFDEDAEITFTLSAFEDTPELPIEDLSYTYDLPAIEGLALVSSTEDGATLRILRRLPLDDVPEINRLIITGTVSYTFDYPVDAEGNRRSVPVSAPFETVVAEFEPSRTDTSFAVSGHVYDEAGTPLEGVEVTLGNQSMTTDPFGAYAFTDNPRDEAVTFHPEDGYGARVENGDATILPLVTVSGRVIAEGETSDESITLTMGDAEPVTPAADGTFEISGPFLDSDTFHVELASGMLARVTENESGYLIYLYAAAKVTGTAADPLGAPVEGLTVTLTSDEEPTQTVQTAPDGTFTIEDLYPATYTASFDVPEGYVLNSEQSITIDVAAGETVALTPIDAMVPATIGGQLLDGDNPYPGITITLHSEVLAVSPSVITDENGRFQFDGLTVGTYAFTIETPEEAILDVPADTVIDTPGQTVSYTIQAVRPGTLSGLVWYDANDDGLQGANETGQEGARVALLDANGEELDTVTTDADGLFTFDGLTPAAYTISVTLPDGMIFAREASGDTAAMITGISAQEAQSEAITLHSGETRDDLACGAVTAGSISGVAWEDQDGNGMYDSGEPSMEGVQVTLKRNDETIVEVATDSDGAYAFPNLRAGDYTMHITLPEGCMFSTQMPYDAEGIGNALPRSESRTAEYQVSVQRGSMDASISIGAQREASLSAHVWLDAEASGTPAEDGGYAGLEVHLYAVSGDTHTELATAMTDEGGNVHFGTLRPGQYLLRYHLPAATGWGFTAGVAEASANWGTSGVLTLSGGVATDAEPVGITQLGDISGVVFTDANYNGLRDTDEAALVATVQLLDAQGTVIAEQETQFDGAYTFTGLRTGQYVVHFTLEDAYAFTRERPDAPSFNSDVPETADASAQTDPVFLPPGETLLVDAGAYRRASISGMAWLDEANSGLYTDANPPLDGITIELLRDGESIATSRTDAEGAFHFGSLPPSEYTLRATLSEGMAFSLPAASEARRSLIKQTDELTGETNPFMLENGMNKANVDIGAISTGAVAGKAVNRKDNQGLPGVTVTLLHGGILQDQTTTDADGHYQFENLRPGEAQVQFSAPDGYQLAEDAINPVSVHIPQGGTAEVTEVPCVPESSIRGRLWLDANADGEATEDEEPLPNVQVELYTIAEGDSTEPVLHRTVASDADGVYAFEGLLPNRYMLRFVSPSGVLFYEGTEIGPFTLGMGEDVEQAAAAYIGSTVSGTVWEDLSGDGLRTADEPLMEGVLVTLMRDDGVALQQTETNAAGAYRFDGIPPVHAAVRFALPEGYLFTTPAEGGSVVPETNEATASTEMMELTMGDAKTAIDAGTLQQTRIGDLVWLDENGNGLQDTSEPGMAGIPVKLWRVNADGTEQAAGETVTDTNGRYRFDAVRPGTYRVSFVIGDAYSPTIRYDGLDQINSKLPEDAEGPEVMTEPFEAQSGRHQLTIDAGLVPAVVEPEETPTPVPTPTPTPIPIPTAIVSPSGDPTAATSPSSTGAETTLASLSETASPSPSPKATSQLEADDASLSHFNEVTGSMFQSGSE